MDNQEQNWIQSARNGDQAAFGQLVIKYQKRVYALTVRMCPTPEAAAEQKELRAQIEAGLRTLSPEHREVLILREIQQLSYDEIADALSLDLGTVKSRISRGRRQLRNFLMEQGNFSDPAASKKPERGL